MFHQICEAGQRVFAVQVEGKVPSQFKRIDPFALTGGRSIGIVLSHTMEITDGKLNIEFIPVIQNPIINGIEVIAHP